MSKPARTIMPMPTYSDCMEPLAGFVLSTLFKLVACKSTLILQGALFTVWDFSAVCLRMCDEECVKFSKQFRISIKRVHEFISQLIVRHCSALDPRHDSARVGIEDKSRFPQGIEHDRICSFWTNTVLGKQ